MKLIDFEFDDLSKIISIAEQRQLNKERNNVKEQAFKPSQKKGFKIHLLGVMGEYAVAKHYNINMDENIYIGSDGGFDLIIENKTIDVKTTTYQNVNKISLILRPEEHERKSSQIYVLCKINDPMQVEIVGCVSWKKFDQTKQISDFGAGQRYFVRANQLSNIDALSQYLFGF